MIFEAICVEISKPNSRNFIVASVYRPPSSAPEFFLAFEKTIKMIDDEDKEFHILGDLNCNILTNTINQPTNHNYISYHNLLQSLRK